MTWFVLKPILGFQRIVSDSSVQSMGKNHCYKEASVHSVRRHHYSDIMMSRSLYLMIVGNISNLQLAWTNFKIHSFLKNTHNHTMLTNMEPKRLLLCFTHADLQLQNGNFWKFIPGSKYIFFLHWIDYGKIFFLYR